MLPSCDLFTVDSHPLHCNGKEANVNRVLDGSTYPGQKLVYSVFGKINYGGLKHNSLYLGLVLSSSGWQSLILSNFYMFFFTFCAALFQFNTVPWNSLAAGDHVTSLVKMQTCLEAKSAPCKHYAMYTCTLQWCYIISKYRRTPAWKAYWRESLSKVNLLVLHSWEHLFFYWK
jgi:hypothetical protein